MPFPFITNFANGEGLVSQDFNDLQRQLWTLFTDNFLLYVGRDAENEPNGFDSTDLAAVAIGGAPFHDSSNNRTSRCAQGMIMQRTQGASPDGYTPVVLPYYVMQDEYGVQHTAASAGSERWDTISVQLQFVEDTPTQRDFKDGSTGIITSQTTNKRISVTPTWTVTEGTEVALGGSPVEPSIPVNHTKIAAFRVYDGMTTFNPFTDIRDWRLPIGYNRLMSSWMPAAEIAHATGSDSMIPGEDGFQCTDDGRAYYMIPNACSTHRVMKVHVAVYKNSLTPDIIIGRRTVPWVTGVSDLVSLLNLTDDTTLFNDASVGTYFRKVNLSNYLDFPVWANGHMAGYAASRDQATGGLTGTGEDHPSMAVVGYYANNSLMRIPVPPQWEIAGGI